MKQVARNLIDPFDGILLGYRFLIIDRDGKYCPACKYFIKDSGTRPILCPARAPNCNAYAERFVRSIKYECLNKMFFFGVGSLQRAIRNYLDHYHHERNHQGLDNDLISPEPMLAGSEGHVQSRDRLGGLLRFYYGKAA